MAAQRQADHFFTLYRHSQHHPALNEQTPDEIHHSVEKNLLASDFKLPSEKLPVYAGQVHFMRRVDLDGTVSVLNVRWAIPKPESIQAVWTTLDIRPEDAQLIIYDRAPGVEGRKVLVAHPFPISEPVLNRSVTDMAGMPPTHGLVNENRSLLSDSRLFGTF